MVRFSSTAVIEEHTAGNGGVSCFTSDGLTIGSHSLAMLVSESRRRLMVIIFSGREVEGVPTVHVFLTGAGIISFSTYDRPSIAHFFV